VVIYVTSGTLENFRSTQPVVIMHIFLLFLALLELSHEHFMSWMVNSTIGDKVTDMTPTGAACSKQASWKLAVAASPNN
jgi:hypothetical protein